MMKKILAMILALCMVLSLCACGKDDIEVVDPDRNNYGSGDEPIIYAPPPPEWQTALAYALRDEGYTSKYKPQEVSDGMGFIHPVEGCYVCEISNGESLYLSDFGTEEKASEHAACYSPSGNTYTSDVSNMKIDYIAPIHFWQAGSFIIEYASETGELMDILNEIFGEEFAGAGMDIYTDDPQPRALEFANVVCLRNNYVGDDYGKDLVEVIESLDELSAYYEQNKDIYGFGEKWLDATADYTAEWFEHNVLIIAKLIEGSGSISHEVTGVKKSGNNISVSIGRITPEIGTCDMAGWHIMMGISKADYNDCAVSVEIADPVIITQGENFAGVDPHIIRTDIIDWDSTHDETVVIAGFEELEGYYEKHKGTFDLEHKEKVYSDTTIGFVDTFKTYNEEWFEENILIMAVVEEGSGSVRHYLERICKEPNGELTILLDRVIPELGTDDMACWHIMVGLEREDYEGTTSVLTKINNVYEQPDECEMEEPEKPVIYLYPEEETVVSVKLTVDGKLTCTYPKYKNGWKVVAQPNGTLTDEKGQTYSYLYWEALTDTEYDFSKGFCVKGEDTAEFLEDALPKLGLDRREANEFIVYWLPRMEQNPYNIIAFQTDAYTESARLEISPAPDTLIRVFMAYKPAQEFVELEAQKLSAPEREGFTVIEWGGAEVESASP